MPRPSSPQPIDGVVAAPPMEETQELDFQLASFPESPQDVDDVEVSRRHRACMEGFRWNLLYVVCLLPCNSWGCATLKLHGLYICLADPHETIGDVHGPSRQSLLSRLFFWDLQVGSLDVAYPDGRHETHPLLTGMLSILLMCPGSYSSMH